MDINPGANTQPNGSPALPGTLVSGPLLAGNIQHSDGSGSLAGVGALYAGLGNVGYALMAQTDIITQAASAGQSSGVFLSTQLIIPAQSQLLFIRGMVTTAWSGASKTFGLGWKNAAGSNVATALTAAGAADGTNLGLIDFSPGTDATRIGHWDNVGVNDIQFLISSTNTGNGVMTLTAVYLQAINQAS